MSGYTKLFQSILESTVWLEPAPIKVVWITMLAMADRDGIIEASVPGLAKRAGVERGDCEKALAIFCAPDIDSRTKAFEGRRIEPAPGGWRLLNYETYRERASVDEARSKAAERQRRKRERDAMSQNITQVTQSNDIEEEPSPSPSPSEDPSKGRSDLPPPRPLSSAMGHRDSLIDGRSQRHHAEHAFGPACDVGACVLPRQHEEFSRRLSVADGMGPDGRALKDFYAATVAEWKAAGKVPGGDVFRLWSTRFEAWIGAESRASNTPTVASHNLKTAEAVMAALDARSELDRITDFCAPRKALTGRPERS